MKKIIYITIAICLFGFASCDKFLEEDPRSNPSTNSFFASKADAFASVNILYRKGSIKFLDGDGIYFGSKAMVPGFMSGLFDNMYKGQEQFIQHCQDMAIDPNSDNNTLEGLWKDCYEAITRNANYAIENIPKCPGLNDNERKQLMGEAYFFRAMNYFYLVKMFGPVPIILNSYSSLTQELFVRRSSEKLVYDQILKDLNEALASGLADKPMWDNGYRVSHGCVEALLADVYLNMTGAPVNDVTKYAEAARLAKSLIENTSYALIEHKDQGANSAYNILRTSDTQREYIYSKEFDKTISNGGWKPVWVFPNEGSTWGEFTYSITGTPYNPVNILHAAYDAVNDLRYQEQQYFHSSYTQVKGDNAGTVRTLPGKTPYFWWEPEAALSTNTSEKDLVHYRLAEMYLIAAEAIVKSGGSVGEAAEYLAAIQARASLNKDFATIKGELQALSADDFVKEVWTEKIRELIFENKIWNDITRTRMYPAVDASGKFGFIPLLGAVNPWGKTFTEDKLYLPICQQEMQRNPALSEPPL